MEAKVVKVYQMDVKKAKAKKLSALGLSYFNGLVIIEVKYSNGALQSTALNPSKTALSIKKNDVVGIGLDRGFITSIKSKGRRLKSGWLF